MCEHFGAHFVATAYAETASKKHELSCVAMVVAHKCLNKTPDFEASGHMLSLEIQFEI